MHIRVRLLVTVALLGLLFLPGSASAAALPLVSVEPSPLVVPLGGAASAEIRIADVSDLFAFQLDLSFDPTLLAVDAVTEGAFLGSDGVATFFAAGLIDNTAGVVSFVAATRLGLSGVTGSGTLAIVDFHALPGRFGTSPLDVDNVVLLDSTLSEIAFAMVPARVSVVSQPGALGLFVAGLGALLRVTRRPRGRVSEP